MLPASGGNLFLEVFALLSNLVCLYRTNLAPLQFRKPGAARRAATNMYSTIGVSRTFKRLEQRSKAFSMFGGSFHPQLRGAFLRRLLAQISSTAALLTHYQSDKCFVY